MMSPALSESHRWKRSNKALLVLFSLNDSPRTAREIAAELAKPKRVINATLQGLCEAGLAYKFGMNFEGAYQYLKAEWIPTEPWTAEEKTDIGRGDSWLN